MNYKSHIVYKLGMVLLFGSTLVACTTVPVNDNLTEKPAYQQAMSASQKGNYDEALSILQSEKDDGESENRRVQAELGIAYVLYKKGEFRKAEQICQAFADDNPTHAQTPYVYYLMGLISMKKGEIQLQQALLAMPSGENEYPHELRKAYKQFSNLMKLFPGSNYIEQSVRRTQDIRRMLARYELHMAHKDMVKGNQDEAIRRSRYVTRYYKDKTSLREALTLMVKAYKELGSKAEQEKAERQLQELIDTPL